MEQDLREIDQTLCFDRDAPFNVTHAGKLGPGHGTVKRAPRNHCLVNTPGNHQALIRFTPHERTPNGFRAPVHTSAVFSSAKEAAEAHAQHIAKLEELGVLRLPTVVRAGTSSLLGSGVYVMTDTLPPGSAAVSSGQLSNLDPAKEAYFNWATGPNQGYYLPDLDNPHQYTQLPNGLVTLHDIEPYYAPIS